MAKQVSARVASTDEPVKDARDKIQWVERVVCRRRLEGIAVHQEDERGCVGIRSRGPLVIPHRIDRTTPPKTIKLLKRIVKRGQAIIRELIRWGPESQKDWLELMEASKDVCCVLLCVGLCVDTLEIG